jgi:predicted tellurium resistance membrane protein TerC
VWGSKFVLKLMDRFPAVITLGAALLGWIAGGMLVGDVVLRPWLEGTPSWLHYLTSTVGAAFVVLLGTWLARRQRREAAPIVELPIDNAAPQPAGDK